MQYLLERYAAPVYREHRRLKRELEIQRQTCDAFRADNEEQRAVLERMRQETDAMTDVRWRIRQKDTLPKCGPDTPLTEALARETSTNCLIKSAQTFSLVGNSTPLATAQTVV